MKIKSIFVRNLTRGDFWNMERPSSTGPVGGGGQKYIDIPMGSISFSQLANFLGITEREMTALPEVEIMVNPIGAGNPSLLKFASRGAGNNTRYRIANQNIHSSETQRHDSWTATNSFPTLPAGIASSGDIPAILVDNIRVFIIKTTDSQYYAGYVNSDTVPADWPSTVNLNEIFNVGSAKIITESELCENTMAIEILNLWKHKPNVLLYGPPGTGKTHIMNQLWKVLNNNEQIECLSIDSSNQNNPFILEAISLPFERDMLTKWVTFHQNYSYENFILATKPVPNGGAFHLEVHAGILLDAAISIDSDISGNEENKTAIIFIDELNRGNVSRIFGEFITFMDLEYRKDVSQHPLPVPLNSLNNESHIRTEIIKLRDGSEVNLPIPWFFPKNVYILASMNSVDRAVAPLDSALSRRLHKINIFPNMDELAIHLNINNPHHLLSTHRDPNDPIKAEEVAWLLLYRVNYELASLMGRDFELGHSYLYSLKNISEEDDKYLMLAKIWDNLIFPQLQERFLNRPNEILRILRLDDISDTEPSEQYLYKQKVKPLSYAEQSESPWTLESIHLSKEFIASQEDVKYTLRFLSGLSS